MYFSYPFIQEHLSVLYDGTELSRQAERTAAALHRFSELYDPSEKRKVCVFSVPGRSELSGNHTDHNRGCVLAATISQDMLAVVSPRDDNQIRFTSEGMGEICTNVEKSAPDPAQFGTSLALIRGICTLFLEHGIVLSGFDAYLTSEVLPGSGLSSSAAFEVMVGSILNSLFASDSISEIEIARMAQRAENVFFGKPCGLLDQTACSMGGIVFMDFQDPAKPVTERIPFRLTDRGYALCITNTGGSHANLTQDYAAIPAEMKSVAGALGKEFLREVAPADFFAALPKLIRTLPPRAVLRAFHFFAENERVLRQKDALDKGDLVAFLDLVRRSGQSSFCYLQNVFSSAHPEEQNLSVALALSEHILEGCHEPSACRVHGGGFAGTIQAFVPCSFATTYQNEMDRVFGSGSCKILNVREQGAVRLIDGESACSP